MPNIDNYPVLSSDLSRAACVARQIQGIALAMPGDGAAGQVDTIEALANMLADRLDRQAVALEVSGDE